MTMTPASPTDTVLLTGATGMVGVCIGAHLRHAGWRVVTLGRSQACDVRADLTVPLTASLPLRPRLVVHCAGLAHVRASDQEFRKVNYEGTANLCDALESGPAMPGALVYISSVAAISPDTPYGRSKALAEDFLRQWSLRTGVPVAILRPALVVGRGAKGNLADMVTAIRRGRYLNVASGRARRSMVLATDVACAVSLAAGRAGTWTLTDGCHPTYGELARALAQSMGRPSPMALPGWAARILARIGDAVGPTFPFNSRRMEQMTTDVIFDSSAARRDLGWQPRPVLEAIPGLFGGTPPM